MNGAFQQRRSGLLVPAISYDNSSEGSGGSVAALTWSHTTAGTNRILFVHILTLAVNAVSSVTYGGVAATLVPNGNCSFGGGQSIYLYVLVNPALGANNVVVTPVTTESVFAGAVSYDGARQTGQPDGGAQAVAASATGVTKSLATISNNCWGVWVYRNNNANSSSMAFGSGTVRINGAAGTGCIFGDSNAPIAAGGNAGVAANNSGISGNNGLIVGSFAP
jgi:hypothetical protein